MDQIQNRDRIEYVRDQKSITRTSSLNNTKSSILDQDTPRGDNLVDCCGRNETEIGITEIASGAMEIKREENTFYPCTTDCSGNPIYGSRAGSNVLHGRFSYKCRSTIRYSRMGEYLQKRCQMHL